MHDIYLSVVPEKQLGDMAVCGGASHHRQTCCRPNFNLATPSTEPIENLYKLLMVQHR